MADDLEQLETWLGGILEGMSPQARRKFARDQAVQLRRSQVARISDQQNPDGSAYAPRKLNERPAFRAKAGRIKRRAASAAAGPMFRKLRRANMLTVQSSESEISVGFDNARTARIARVHQEGLRDRVTRAKDSPIAQYPARQLLGFTEEDRRRLMDAALALVAGD